MWTLTYTKSEIAEYKQQLISLEDFMRSADFSTNLSQPEKNRQKLLAKLNKLENIHTSMHKCIEMEDAMTNMDDYIAQKSLVYNLIQAYIA
tara:strand:+ start:5637 stop:5909 length:273 start_codon:yes stop_codon:yes gene_type:complete